MVRNSLKYVSYKDRKDIASDLKQIYNSLNEQEAEIELNIFGEKWDLKYPVMIPKFKDTEAHYNYDVRFILKTTKTDSFVKNNKSKGFGKDKTKLPTSFESIL